MSALSLEQEKNRMQESELIRLRTENSQLRQQLSSAQQQLQARGAVHQAPAPSAPLDPQAQADLQRVQRTQKQNNAAQKRYRSRQKEKVNNLVKRSEALEVENKALKLRVAQLEAALAARRWRAGRTATWAPGSAASEPLTALTTITIVTSPAEGMPAAPMAASVAVMTMMANSTGPSVMP